MGAGFSKPAGLPLWGQLIMSVASTLPETSAVRGMVAELVAAPNAQDLDLAAQMLVDELGRHRFEEHLRQDLTVDHR